MFSTSEKVESRRIFREREQPVEVLGSNESIFRVSNLVNVARSLLDGNRDHLLTQAGSELVKQEHKVESRNSCMNELQQSAYAQTTGIGGRPSRIRCESRRLQEELVMKEKSSSRYSDLKYARDGRNAERSKIYGLTSSLYRT